MPVEILLAFSAVKPLPLPANIPVFAVMLAAVMLPLTPNDPNVPTVVKLEVTTVELNVVPTMLPACTLLNPLALPVNTPVLAVNATAVTVPLTPNDDNVPTDVMFGCAAVVTVPAVVALVAAPLNAPTNVVAYNAPLLVFATNVAFAVSAMLPVNALPNNK